jgi:hypothetical protein
VHRAPRDFYLEAPFAVAILETASGYRLLSTVTGELDALAIGDTVQLSPVAAGELVVPHFTRLKTEPVRIRQADPRV